MGELVSTFSGKGSIIPAHKRIPFFLEHADKDDCFLVIEVTGRGYYTTGSWELKNPVQTKRTKTEQLRERVKFLEAQGVTVSSSMAVFSHQPLAPRADASQEALIHFSYDKGTFSRQAIGEYMLDHFIPPVFKLLLAYFCSQIGEKESLEQHLDSSFRGVTKLVERGVQLPLLNDVPVSPTAFAGYVSSIRGRLSEIVAAQKIREALPEGTVARGIVYPQHDCLPDMDVLVVAKPDALQEMWRTLSQKRGVAVHNPPEYKVKPPFDYLAEVHARHVA